MRWFGFPRLVSRVPSCIAGNAAPALACETGISRTLLMTSLVSRGGTGCPSSGYLCAEGKGGLLESIHGKSNSPGCAESRVRSRPNKVAESRCSTWDPGSSQMSNRDLRAAHVVVQLEPSSPDPICRMLRTHCFPESCERLPGVVELR